jgi:hypothetical protein
LVAGDPLPADAGAGEGEVLLCAAGVLPGRGEGLAAVRAGVADGLGFACRPELPAAPVFWAGAVAAITIASAKT